MDKAGGEIAIWCRETRIVLDSEKQFRQRLLEAPAEQLCGANYIENLAKPAAWAETQRSLGTLDCSVKLARKKQENGTDVPAARKARVERQRPIDQRHNRADILAEIGQREGGIGQSARIVTGHLQRPPGEIDTLAAVCRGVGTRPIRLKPKAADRSPSECRPETRIALDRPLEKTERRRDLLRR